MRFFAITTLFFSLSTLVWGELPISVDRNQGEFTVVLLPDTQRYTWMRPATFYEQVEWIRRNRDELDIRFVIHLGDVVDDYTDAEWEVADRAMAILDGVVPYSIAPGNHDMVRGDGRAVRGLGKYNAVFPPGRFRVYDGYGAHKGKTTENSYWFFEGGGVEYLVLSLEFGASDEALAWAGEILLQFPDKRVIVATHAYMYDDDTRIGEGDLYSPHKHDTSWNDGEQIWEKFVRHHPNIHMVVSGHIKGDGAGRLISRGDSGNPVYQMLSNYQMLENGGNGWLRVLKFAPEEKKVYVTTLSPLLGRIDPSPEQTFVIDEEGEEFRPVRR